MRMSCNGCRVLRKGCSEDCTLRPCLQWIKTPESQANATVFLAKFYGRAGLVNLINAGPEHLRPEVFKSLLYEACGRIINPIYGSVGLMWSGNWKRVQEAVESVLEGSPIMQVDQEEGRHHPIMPIKGSDIRHLSNKDTNSSSIVHHQHHHRIRAPRNRFKRPCRNTPNTNTNTNTAAAARGVVVDSVVTHEQQHDEPIKFSITGWVNEDDVDESDDQLMMMMMKRAESHDSFSVETVEHSLVNQTDQFVKSEPRRMASDPAEIIGLELTLGINPMRRSPAAFNLDVI